MSRTRPRLSTLLIGCTLVGCASSTPTEPAPVRVEVAFATTIHQPRTLGLLDTGLDELTGRRTGTACDTCHGPAEGEALAAQAKNPHVDLELVHGTLRCDSCHEREDRTRLRLADGTRLAFADTLLLCAQCHGPQKRDYDHGAHGGMSGYWDLSRGPRVRNQCVDCHAAHTPARAQVQPAPPPRDRGLTSARGSHP